MAKTQNYKWSSYHEYVGQEKIINKKVLLHYFNNDISEFIKYTISSETEDIDDVYNYAEYEIINRLLDEDLIKIIMIRFGIDDINNVVRFFKNKSQKELIEDLKIIKKIKGARKTQVARVLRINRKIVNKIWESN